MDTRDKDIHLLLAALRGVDLSGSIALLAAPESGWEARCQVTNSLTDVCSNPFGDQMEES